MLVVTVDGDVTEGAARTSEASDFYQTYTLRGLTDGPHTVQFKVTGGRLVVDSVGVAGAPK